MKKIGNGATWSNMEHNDHGVKLCIVKLVRIKMMS